ncbi:MAG: TrkH family potassium uptake protein [Halieaceae bacterium]|jgi:trk system potassium uptake protein TrkH|nr:TrkH family potassium uptake protein [Halieaceae bacterium]
MHFPISLRILGILLMLFSLTLLVPLLMALVLGDGTTTGFLSALGITLTSGFVLWFPFRRARQELRTRDGFLVTTLFWTVLGLFGALPFALHDGMDLDATDAIFESISGLTTTGATVITGLDELPRSLLFYRQQLQWLGGIGIIVVALAILPMLGVGGMQLYQAETPGPSKDAKLTPRITETAKALFFVYLFLTAGCGLCYLLAGMTPFDAICHAFSTVAIGGFSTHDASIGYFDSAPIMLVSCLFMYIAAINFGLHFTAWRRRSARPYVADSETVFFSAVLAICIVITCTVLLYTETFSPADGIAHGLFQAISITTTTGFVTSDFARWPSFLPLMLLVFAVMGGCGGSTGGGIKAMRLMLISKQGIRELKQLVHPQAVIPLKVGKRRVEAKVVSAVWSFLAVYLMCFVMLMIMLVATGLDFETAFSAVAASLNNLGPGLGAVTYHYGDINDVAKWLLCVAMLLGRLEVFTVLVLFTPAFWRP